ncbi:hypothetical protein SAMN05421820_103394 [Pedobacter steynii]|uniref:GLPGLI family protein n=1 Tax=Pedobacter steynii TaxID=430522 RepID=A0A1G9RXD3_9SPHI|nr:hypothetical protein [Pedobacter steynii]NQX37615.1 hypothetical protein [Pedobacter steynii]SDM27842.1 hypothetical protein SAMN05421820_103394 [Pedobacter steynii]
MKILFFSTILLLILITNGIQAQDSVTFDDEKPLFKFQDEQLANPNKLLRYAALTGYREGVAPVRGQFNVNFKGYNDEKTETRRIYMYNLSIQDMLTHGLVKPNQVFLEVKDPSKYRYDPKQGTETEWLRKNGYCYELLLPLGVLKGMHTLDNEIRKIFNVTSGWEKRKVKTWILVRTSSTEKFKSSGGDPFIDQVKGTYRNVNIGIIGVNSPVPFLDETGYKKAANIDLGIDISTVTDVTILRKALQKYDLDVKEEIREKSMFVITENKK